MTNTVVIVVDLDAAVAPPAADSVRQLLALIDGLPTEGGDLDWRLVSVSVNSPLRAEIQAFTRDGEEVSEARVVEAAHIGFGLLGAVNDNEADFARSFDEPDKKRLRALLAPMRHRNGRIQISVPGRFEQTMTADRADRALTAINRAPRKRPPELGSIEGQILSATTHYGAPALRVRRFLSEEDVLCVFERGQADLIGAAHTLEEVWRGRRVVISGKVSFDPSGRATTVNATQLRTLGGSVDALGIIRRGQETGERAAPQSWGADD